MRKLWLAVLAVVAAGCLLAGCTVPLAVTRSEASSTISAAEPVELVAASWLSEASPPHVDMDPFEAILEDWMNTIEKETSGRVKFKFYPEGNLIKEADGWKAVKDGFCDVYLVLGVSYPDIFPRTSLMGLPDLFPNATIASQVMQQMQEEGDIAAEWQDVKVLWHSATAPADVGSTVGQIKTLEDWSNLKVAVVGEPETSTVKALGAVPVEIPKTEQYLALKNHLVDAAWLELNGQLIFKFNEVVKYHTICSGGVRTLNYVMNLKTYNSLPEDIRKIIDANTGILWALKSGELFDAAYLKALDYLNQTESAVYTPSPSEFQRWQQAWGPVKEESIAHLEAEGIDGRAIFDKIVRLSQDYSNHYFP